LTLFPFNIRIYGIIIDNNKVLVSDEIVKGNFVTKFPGGGLQFGEGPLECIKREMMEETGQEFEVVKHVYTTDFFQRSAFDPNHQVISIYYQLSPVQPIRFLISDHEFNFKENTEGAQSFRWIQINKISQNLFTLPIDRVVGELLKKNYG